MSKPRGKWIIVNLTVANTGNEPQSFFVQNQKLFDEQGREYAADTMAALSMNGDDAMIIDMNPGFSAKVMVPFDVPTGTDPESVELHDSAFSGGVTVHV
jgi:hypothetical protein